MPGEAVYCGTKAFDLNLAEGLWAELGPLGIDVIAGVCPAMDTPSLQAGLAPHGLTIPGLYQPKEVVDTLLRRIDDGPLHIFGFGPEADQAPVVEDTRRNRVKVMTEVVKMFHGH
jgi:short-subunit dehydrogenase